MEKKCIHVAAAIMIREGRLFAAQRGYGPQKGGYELPGGKIEPGESGEEAICREILEELNVKILAERKVLAIEYDYPDFHLSMDCFLCRIVSGEIHLKEHTAAGWFNGEELRRLPWLPADEKALPMLLELLERK